MDNDGAVWRAIVDTMQEGVMVVDTRGRIEFVNPAFEHITGYGAGDIVGRSCEILQCDQCFRMRAAGVERYCGLFRDGKVKSTECIFRHADGRPLHLLKNAAVLRDAAGRIVGGVETLVDLSRVVAGEQRIAALERQLDRRPGFEGIVGRSPVLLRVLDLAASAARSHAPVFIRGASGTGKELLAAAIHRRSPRAAGPYVAVNCAALNDNLLESELFGHVRGAFTGATRDRTGRFEAAHNGTIFLDEIGDLSLATQTKLLRVLQEGEIQRVGENRPVKVDVRLISATHRDLEAEVAAGRFREDLYYRINVIPLVLPELRQRAGDVPLLVEHVLGRLRRRAVGRGITGVTPAALHCLCQYPWPGNVRELINALEYAAVVCPGGAIDVDHLPPAIAGAVQAGGPATPITAAGRPTDHDQRRQRILAALDRCGWNRTRAAQELGVSRVTLWKWMRRLGIGAAGNPGP